MRILKKSAIALAVLLAGVAPAAFTQAVDGYPASYARSPRFRALIVWDSGAEEAHVQFDKQAMEFFRRLSYGEGFIDATQNLLFTNAFRWVVSQDPKGNPFEK